MRGAMWRVLLVGATVAAVVLLSALFYEGGLVDPTSFSSSEGAVIFREACARCHGPKGEGLANMPTLRGRRLHPDLIRSVVRRGRRNMPRFPKIQGRALDNLARYVSALP